MTEHQFPAAMVLYANYARFAPGQRVEIKRVESRMLLWCRQGKGRVDVNGRSFPLTTARFLFLPWNHHIVYRADQTNPFLLAGIHLAPHLTSDGPVAFRVSHFPDEVIMDGSKRRDLDLAALTGIQTGHFSQWPALEALADYILQWFLGGPGPVGANQLAQCLLRELLAWQQGQPDTPLPANLRRACMCIEQNLAAPLEVEDLARAAGRSVPTVFRLFRENLGTTPMLWLRRQRLHKAAELLQTTSLPIGTVGAQVGIRDPRYFARLFRRAYGCTATQYRRRSPLL